MADSHGDPGLQPERTSLAWSRTIASIFTVLAMGLKVFDVAPPLAGAILVPVFAAALGTFLKQRTMYRSAAIALAMNQGAVGLRRVVVAGVTTVILGLACFLMSAVAPTHL